jgi:hypothetical protein
MTMFCSICPKLLAVLTSLVLETLCSSSSAMTATEGGMLPKPLPLLPADNWWNLDISDWPVDPGSVSYIAFINNGSTRRLHPDLGGDAPTSGNPSASYGMPYVVVSGVAASDLVPVEFQYSNESDGVDHTTGSSYPFYPIPPDAVTQAHWMEGGAPGNVDQRDSQDRHLLLVDYDRNYLYELYNVFFDAVHGRWHAGSGAFFDLNTNHRRPDGWTSADAAGLAILPGLIRFDEVYDPTQEEIDHAFRVTVRGTDGYVYPASHRAGSRAGALPMGARLRLKSSVDVAQRTKNQNMQKIFRAMQRHGLIVADNGSDLFITGTYDPRWNSDVLNPAFASLTANDFEIIQLGYNPSPMPASGTVQHLRAALTGKALSLAWDKEAPSVRYRVEATDRMTGAALWRTIAETADNTWAGVLDSTLSAQYYRVLLVAIP